MIRWHKTYAGYGLDPAGRPVSARQGAAAGPRPIRPERRPGREPRLALRWRGHTVKVGLSDFARECREGGNP